jgi:hypothetical protein
MIATLGTVPSVVGDGAVQCATRLNGFDALSVRAIERAARYSHELAGDALRFTFVSVHTAVQAIDLPVLLRMSTDLINQLLEQSVSSSSARWQPHHRPSSLSGWARVQHPTRETRHRASCRPQSGHPA